MHKWVPYIVSAAVLVLAVAAVAAQNGTAQVIGGDEAALRELLSRSLAAYPAYGGNESTVHVGSLPESLPIELDLPDNMRIIGSVQRGAASPTEIYLDAPEPPAAVIDFFEDAFSGDDWQLVDAFPGGGFTTVPSDSVFYCSETFETLVSVNAFSYEDGSDTRLYISPADASRCADASGSSTPDPYRLLPQLQTPAGVTLLQSGGGGGGGSPGFQSVFTQAYLESDLPVAEIAEAYIAQLAAAGWQPIAQESGDNLAWSGWTVEGEGKTWGGTLTLTASPTADNRYAAILMLQETSSAS